MLLTMLSGTVTMGFDNPENIRRYKAAVDSLKVGMKWGVIVVGDGDTVIVGDSTVGVAPLRFKPDSFPVSLVIKRGESKRLFYVDTDTSSLVVIYSSPYKETSQRAEERAVELPPYEEEEDGLIFNVHGKRVVVVKSLLKGRNRVSTFADTSTLRYYWPRIDSLIRKVEGKGMVFIGALKVSVDGVRYPNEVDLINRVLGGVHYVVADGIRGEVRAYVNMDRADVVVFVLVPSSKWLFKVRPSKPLDVNPRTFGCVGAAVGGPVGCCVGAYSGMPHIGCVVGSIVGAVLGTLLGSSCM